MGPTSPRSYGLVKSKGHHKDFYKRSIRCRNVIQPKSLGIVAFLMVLVLVVKSSNLASLVYEDKSVHSFFSNPPSSTNEQGRSSVLTPSSDEVVLVVKDVSGLRRIPLAQKKEFTLEFPFMSFYAELTVVTLGDAIPVIVDKGKHGRELNFTLALGANTFFIELNHKGSTAINGTAIYKFTMIRHDRTVKYDHNAAVEECYLEQDCDLIIYPDRKCGTQAMKYWTSSQHVRGYWRLNCNNCSFQESCLWSEAEWIERDKLPTHQPLLNISSTRICFNGHQVLFLGDSTMRGLMLAMMERVNTTPNYVDRKESSAHNNVGLGTNFSLTYFNPYHRNGEPSTFDQRLKDMSAKYPVAGKEKKTLIIVGGTQWLQPSQLLQVKNFITKWGIPPGNVYIKLHASAFHVYRKRYAALNLQPLQQLMADNDKLRQLAVGYGFGVVETLQMTLSRFKEFQSGYCACHFHWMEEHVEDTSKVKGMSKKLSPYPRYHMVGDINNAYTDLLIRQICGGTLS